MGKYAEVIAKSAGAAVATGAVSDSISVQRKVNCFDKDCGTPNKNFKDCFRLVFRLFSVNQAYTLRDVQTGWRRIIFEEFSPKIRMCVRASRRGLAR
jgi:hypothetical protein